MSWWAWLLLAWFAWAIFNIAVTMFAPAPRSIAYTAGLLGTRRIVIAPELRLLLTADEIRAVTAHELGHEESLHTEINLAWAIFAFGIGRARRAIAQEFEADAYAARLGHGVELARALTKIGNEPARVARLLAISERAAAGEGPMA